MTHTEYVQGLRNAADWLESRPELGVPTNSVELNYYSSLADGSLVDSVAGLAKFASIVGGKIDKTESNESFYKLVAKRDGFSVRACALRSAVCERIQVGTKIEPAHTLPAQEETDVPEREVPIYEYKCPQLLSEAL